MARRNLTDKRVLVTGATSGIGAALARALARERCRLLLTGRRQQRLDSLAESLRSTGVAVEIVIGDLVEPTVRAALVAAARERFGGLDVLVNNAGLGAYGPFLDADEARLRQVMEVNFFAPVELARLCLPLMTAGTSPLLVNLGSVLGHRGVPNKSEYCASKFALHGWSDALRAELVGRGVDVLHVCPSTTKTEFFDRVLAADDVERPAPQKTSRGAMTPEAVAARIVRAMRRGDHEIVLSPGGKLLVWLDRLWPSLADRLVARFG